MENIFGDSFTLLVGQDPSEITGDAPLVFGPLSLTVAPKVPYARTGLPSDQKSQAYFYVLAARKAR